MDKLWVDILRGKNAVGENLIEVSDGTSSLLLEYGTQLTPTAEGKEMEDAVRIKEYDAVFITHSHADHCGLLKRGTKARRIYMGESTYKILSYCNGIKESLRNKIVYLENEKTVRIGKIKVTPYICDHSAYDSYMLLIEKDGERILYTGDFRANGRKSFSYLLKRLPKKVDVLITEGTNLGWQGECITERDLEERVVKLCKEKKKIFVLQSTLNIDRTVTMYRASKRTGKKFIQKLASAEVCGVLNNIPEPIKFNECYTYLQRGVNVERHKKIIDKYGKKLLSKNNIAKLDSFMMQVSSDSSSYLQSLAGLCNLRESVLIYSMWGGYKQNMQEFLSDIKALGIEIIDLHTSGHADVGTIEILKQRVNPSRIYFVHCEKEKSIQEKEKTYL